ncbi:MAG: hypothetical protein AVDCRST_MAG59-4323 [uncultured Thermomicrobiales bacterium]|uniref:Uncharacterized protein n=1 Tax=uncultured Thermomicrobiales bacterium TaxID=1645740 RepID=A0A6J4VGA4_9BACT|nr:MAG: hypothetical protein AVDCRST_MAG59-4323 [uncultured Thermomicrobiales bacterium]
MTAGTHRGAAIEAGNEERLTAGRGTSGARGWLSRQRPDRAARADGARTTPTWRRTARRWTATERES